jgi:signal transduction histidine kinase
LGNSDKFSKHGSVIDLTVSLISSSSRDKKKDAYGDSQTNISALDYRDVICFCVKDYGKGINKKEFKTIFEPFSQASKETQMYIVELAWD